MYGNNGITFPPRYVLLDLVFEINCKMIVFRHSVEERILNMFLKHLTEYEMRYYVLLNIKNEPKDYMSHDKT